MKHKSIAIFLSIFIWVLVIIVLVTLAAAMFLTFHGVSGVSADASNKWNDWSLLPAIAISAGVLIAILTFARERHKDEAVQVRQTSKVMLERAALAFDTSISLLRDKDNSRVTWVRAARTLLRAMELGEAIKDPDYRRVYELETERARNELYDVLTVPSPETGAKQPLPPQFFYGISDWQDGQKTLDEAAIAASTKSKVYDPNINELRPRSDLTALAVESVIAIYDFLKYPDDYRDPLNGVVRWGDDWAHCFGPAEGAKKYVAHTRQKLAHNGKLYDREPRVRREQGQ